MADVEYIIPIFASVKDSSLMYTLLFLMAHQHNAGIYAVLSWRECAQSVFIHSVAASELIYEYIAWAT